MRPRGWWSASHATWRRSSAIRCSRRWSPDRSASVSRTPRPSTASRSPTCCATSDEIVMPGITHWQSPNFFAYFPANASGPSILGDLLSSGLGVQGMLWATSPACTELETHVLDWLVDLLGLPGRFRSAAAGGRSHPGHRVEQHPDRAARRARARERGARSTSTASGSARRAARTVIPSRGPDGGSPPRLTVYTSRHAHSSIEKAIKIAGLGAHQFAARRRRRPPRDAGRCAGGRDRRGPRGRRDPRDGERNGGHHVRRGRVDPVRRHRRGLPPRGRLAPRGPPRTRAAPPSARKHRGLVDGVELARQLHVQSPPQVAAHELRLQLLLGGGSGCADRRAEHPSGSTCATGRRHPARSSTTATGTCPSGAGSAP